MQIDLLKNFIIDKKIINKNIIIFIGTINNQPAIYIKPFLNFIRNDIIHFEEIENKKLKIIKTISTKLIYPATMKHINKYKTKLVYTEETYDNYLMNNDFLEIKWIDNIINTIDNLDIANKDKSDEQILINNFDYFMVPDTKWDKNNINNAYYLMIFKNKKYKSIRDLDDYKLLERAKKDVLNYCTSLGLDIFSFLLYFHYRPSYFRLHLHVVNISSNLNFVTSPSRNVLLDDVIKNLKIDKDYYKNTFYYIESK